MNKLANTRDGGAENDGHENAGHAKAKQKTRSEAANV